MVAKKHSAKVSRGPKICPSVIFLHQGVGLKTAFAWSAQFIQSQHSWGAWGGRGALWPAGPPTGGLGALPRVACRAGVERLLPGAGGEVGQVLGEGVHVQRGGHEDEPQLGSTGVWRSPHTQWGVQACLVW